MIEVEIGALRLLTLDGVRDAARRRVVPVVLVVCFLSLMMINSCTQCSADVQIQGDTTRVLDVLAWAGVAVYGVMALWCIALAGLLASDHLSASLEDGSAQLLLSRPVGRGTLVLSRLLGSLVVSLGAGLVLLLGATFFLVTRSGLSLEPALWATVSTLLNATTIAALAMVASLYLPRIAIFLLLFTGIALFAGLNLFSVSGSELGGIYKVLDAIGPPLVSAIAVTLAPWSGQEPQNIGPFVVALKLVGWVIGSLALLLFVFGRRELTDLEPR
jgi:ABC-type transport system involved in multi-copper enzyme maturation permease subunit